jgi:hypothetical protein
MSDDDFTVHTEDCEKQSSGWMPISDLPDEVSEIDDLDCTCWEEYDSLSAFRSG